MRSLFTSVLCLALFVPLAACGGSSDPPKDATDPAAADKDKDTSSDGDPVADAQATMDGLQKSVDDTLQPFKDADALLASLGTLAADLKAAKSRVDARKILVEIKKIPGGGEPAIDKLKIKDTDPGKAIVQDRIDKTKALFASLKDLDGKIKDVTGKIADAGPKLAAAAAKALPKLELKIKSPLGSDDDKKKAQDQKDKITGMADSFKTKSADWAKTLGDLPGKAKDLPGKFAALK